jgi:alkylhydroperoxidase family enzyme
MARVNGVNIDEVPQEVREIFEEQMSRYGSVLNTARVYALRPTIYKGVQALGKGIQDSGLIDPELRHLVCVKAASINGCPY